MNKLGIRISSEVNKVQGGDAKQKEQHKLGSITDAFKAKEKAELFIHREGRKGKAPQG